MATQVSAVAHGKLEIQISLTYRNLKGAAEKKTACLILRIDKGWEIGYVK